VTAVIDDGDDHVPVIFGRRAAGRDGDATCVFKRKHGRILLGW
jgi:hypothetical protein